MFDILSDVCGIVKNVVEIPLTVAKPVVKIAKGVTEKTKEIVKGIADPAGARGDE